MKKHSLFSWLAVVILIALALPFQGSRTASAAAPTPKTLRGDVPQVVANGQAQFVAHHPGGDTMSLGVGLLLRNKPALNQFLRNVTDPANPGYHHYMTQEQANKNFNPTAQQEQQVVTWLRANGLSVTHTYRNHLLVDARGTFAQVERMLHVTLNDYTGTAQGTRVSFYAPSNEPVVDASVSDAVGTIIGLDNYPRIRVTGVNGTVNGAPHSYTTPANGMAGRSSGVHALGANGRANGGPPYYPQDFADAYDVNPLWNAGYKGSGQHIGITLWASPPSDSTLQRFASITGADVATQANGRLNVIPPSDGGSPAAPSRNPNINEDEVAMDIEYTSGMAPGATIDYYEGDVDASGNPTNAGLADALNLAGTDPNNDNQEISSSWGGCEQASDDAYVTAVESILATNSATGHNYFFSSGDSGSSCDNFGADPWPQYPASSAYVTSVGGTRFVDRIDSTYPGESTWTYCTTCRATPLGSGGGYSNLFSRPDWQVGNGLDDSGMRAYPDVAADADQGTPSYVLAGASATWGFGGDGTSLATPLWAGMLALINQYLAAQGQPAAGFVTPTLYYLATHSQTYVPYHDITCGSNGFYGAGPGWDAATGWGTPDLTALADDMVSPGTSPVPPSATGETVCSAVSRAQYSLKASDGSGWHYMDRDYLSLGVTPRSNCTAVVSGNADLFTGSVGYNQDLGILVSGGSYGSRIVAWKESGGSAPYSPNAAAVQAAVPLAAGTPYTFSLVWKANRPDPGTIYAGVGAGSFSPTRVTALCSPAHPVQSAFSTYQYGLRNSDGHNWRYIDANRLSVSITPPSDCNAIVSGNADLWTSWAGYSQDIGIAVSGGSYPAGHIVAWKESSGSHAHSPNAAFVQTLIPLTGGTTYTFGLAWKANKADPGTIYAGVGGGPFSPTRVTAFCSSNHPAGMASSQAQYRLSRNDGGTWYYMDQNNLTLTITTGSACQAILAANADLWTSSAGYNQDIGIWVSGGAYGNGHLVAWTESGGSAPSSPNSTFVHTVIPLAAGGTYTVSLVWKANRSDPGTIWAGAGPSGTAYSPTSLTGELVSSR